MRVGSNKKFHSPELYSNTGMQSTHKASLNTCNVPRSSFPLCSKQTTLQTPVYQVFDHAI